MSDKYKEATPYLINLTELTDLTYGSIYCLWHPNSNTKAARLFLDKDGVERVWCYAENRQYTSYDYLTQILGIKNIKDYLLKKFTEEEIDNAYLKSMRYKNSQEEIIIPEFKNAESFFKELYLGEYYANK